MKLKKSKNYPRTYLEFRWLPFMTIHDFYVFIILEFVCIVQDSFFHAKMKMVMEVLQSQLTKPIPRICIEAVRGGEKWG